MPPVAGPKLRYLKLIQLMLILYFQTTNLVIHIVKMQLILCCVPQPLNTAYPSGNVFYASANHVRLLLSQPSSLILPARPP
eukprot:scaffold232782_cov73-Attheya_sp.AAC.1